MKTVVKSNLREVAWIEAGRVAVSCSWGHFPAVRRLESGLGARVGATAMPASLSAGGSAGRSQTIPGRLKSIQQPRIVVAHVSHAGAHRPSEHLF